MQRRVDEPNDHREISHRGKDALEVSFCTCSSLARDSRYVRTASEASASRRTASIFDRPLRSLLTP